MKNDNKEFFTTIVPVDGKVSLHIDADWIVVAALFVFGISKEVMQSESRKRPIPDCRRVICYLLDKYTALSHREIGILIGDREKSTVGYAIESCIELQMVDKEFARKIIQVEQRLEGTCA
jgi:chromosomal replication initiator protein